MLALGYIGLSALVCATTLAGLLAAANQPMTPVPGPAAVTTQAVDQPVLLGGLGVLVSVGLGLTGIYYWPQSGTARVRKRKEDPSLSTYHSVTGLPTQRLFLVLLSQALSRAANTQRSVAVLIVQLAQFRPSSPADSVPNQTLVERVEAARIKSALQSHDAVARLDEHRFAVILDNLTAPESAVTIAETIQRTMSLPLLVEGQEFLLACRIAGVLAPFDGTDGEALLDAAAQLLTGRQTDDASIKFLSDPSTLSSGGRGSAPPHPAENISRQRSLTLPH